jgi:hypothetical protein
MPSKDYELNGTTYSFDDNASPEQIKQFLFKKHLAASDAGVKNPALAAAGIVDKPELVDKIRYYAGHPVANAMSAIGGTVGGIAGSESGPGAILTAGAGAGLGSAIKDKLQQIAPRLFGQDSNPNQSLSDALIGQTGDAITQGALPEAGGTAITNALGLGARAISKSPAAKAFMEKTRLNELYDKAMGYLKPPDAVIPVTQNVPTPSPTNPPVPYTGGVSPGELSLTDKIVNARANRSMALKGIASKKAERQLTNDEVRAAADKENQRLVTQHEETSNLIMEHASPANKTFDASAAYDALVKNPNKYGNVDPEVKDFLKTAIASRATNKLSDKSVLSYQGNRLLIYGAGALGGALTGHSLGGLAAGAAADVTLNLGNKAIARILEDPAKAALFKKALTTPITAPESKLLGALLVNSIRGAEVAVQAPEDKLVKGYINNEGQVVTQ